MMLLLKRNNMETKKIISFEASEELKEALRIAAFRNSMSISAYIREVLQSEVADILKQIIERSRPDGRLKK